MSRRHGNHFAEEKVAAIAGEVGQGSKAHRIRRCDGLQRRLKGACQPAHKRRGGGVAGTDGAFQAQPFQAHVPQGVAGGVQQGRQRVRFIYVQLRLLPGQVLLFAQHALMRAPKGVASLEDGGSRPEGRTLVNAQRHGKFYRDAAQIEQQHGGCGEVYGQVHTFSTIVKTFFPN